MPQLTSVLSITKCYLCILRVQTIDLIIAFDILVISDLNGILYGCRLLLLVILNISSFQYLTQIRKIKKR